MVSIDNFKYYIVFVDHFTRYTWLYPLRHKYDVKDVFIWFKSIVENHFNTLIKTLHTHNGGEFIVLTNFLSLSGISHLTTPPHTQEHNGIAEKNTFTLLKLVCHF